MYIKYFSMLFIAATLLFPTVAVYASEMDTRIETTFNNSYVYKIYLHKDEVRIQSKEGVVTLTGTVFDEDHKSLAQETAAGLPGVGSVDNQIQVKAKKSEEYSDGWLGLKIKTALLFHRSVSGLRTHVEVKDGVVTLTGKAYSQAEKELAGEYAEDIPGVKGVKNEITVVQAAPPSGEKVSEKIDDASITAQVKLALLAHRSTSVIHTGVTTQEGTVTITGKAKSQAEKDLVTQLVTDIKGVKNVVNNMEISP